MGRRVGSVGLVVMATLLGTGLAAAQSPSRTLGRLMGVVVDADSGRPVPLADVALVRVGGGVDGQDLSQAVTSPAGGYAFEGLSAGRYRLRVSRVGYASQEVEVTLEPTRAPRVSFSLEVEPVALEPVTVEVAPPPPSAELKGDWARDTGERRIRAERLRQDRYLVSDARIITRDDIRESLTVGEEDVFRALRRLPGVTGPNEIRAETWVRGMTWDLSRVFFDQMPLLNPLHGGGLLSGVAPEIVGTLAFHPGVRPVSVDGGAAAVVDITSRPAGLSTEPWTSFDLSLVNFRVFQDVPIGENGGIAVAVRRTFVDWFAGVLAGNDRQIHFPFHFREVALRGDAALSPSLRLEASLLVEDDHISGDLPDVVHGTRAQWGNRVARVTIRGSVGRDSVAVTAGLGRYQATVLNVPVDSSVVGGLNAPSAPPLLNQSDFVVLQADWTRFRGEGDEVLRGGLRIQPREWRYDGAIPVPYPGPRATSHMRWGRRHVRWSGWGELEAPGFAGGTARLGLRVEGLGADVALAPRLTVLWDLGGVGALSVGVGRQHQFEQAVSSGGVVEGPLAASQLWIEASALQDRVVADIATVGLERWVGRGSLMAVTGWARRSQGHLMPDPSPHPVFVTPPGTPSDPGRGWVRGAGSAQGLELSARRLAGRFTGSAAYSLTRANTSASGVTVPAAGRRRHALDLVGSLRLGGRYRLGLGYAAASGVAFTSFRRTTCPEDPRCEGIGAEDAPLVVGFAGRANDRAMRPHQSMDAQFDWIVRGADPFIELYFQVRNLLNRRNQSFYLGVDYWGADYFEGGLPRFPFLGARVRF